jgi:hypothetical protein
MATVRLGRYEVEEYELPCVCARCGAKAVVWPHKRFAWSPPWIGVLILLGGLGLLLLIILALVLTKRMTVPLPLCERHRNYWRNRGIFIWGGLLAVVLLAVVAITLGAVLDDKRITESAVAITVLGSIGLFFVWLISAAVVQYVGIRPSEITDRAITLTGLSRDFVDAVREDRRGDDDEDDDDRPRARRRDRDEDEDDRPRARRRERDDEDEDRGRYYDPDRRRRGRDEDKDER